MNIVLIGMRGSGKTSIGKKLEKVLNKKLVETDNLIEEKVKMTVRKIVETYGWKMFRKFEKNIIGSVSKLDNVIISTGGGVVLDKINIKRLKENGFIVWLKAKPEVLAQRIKNDTNRPSLNSAKTAYDDIKITWKLRRKLYQEAADCIINTGNVNIEKATQKIIKIFKDYEN